MYHDEGETDLAAEAQQSRSPKRQSSTVYERVKTKLSRSFSFATCASSNTSPPVARDLEGVSSSKLSSSTEKENYQLNDSNYVPPQVEDASVPDVSLRREENKALKTGLRDHKVTTKPRRCRSELSSPTTAQLLADFVASRCNNPTKEGRVNSCSDKIHTTSNVKSPNKCIVTNYNSNNINDIKLSNTQPILSVDHNTGIIAVNTKWTCDKCSYAYNDMKADKCDICECSSVIMEAIEKVSHSGEGECVKNVKVKREPSKNDQLSGDFQLITNDIITSLSNGTDNNDESDLKESTAVNTADSGSAKNDTGEEASYHSQIGAEGDGAMSADFWVCKRCTLENPGPALTCLACSIQREGEISKNNAPKKRYAITI